MILFLHHIEVSYIYILFISLLLLMFRVCLLVSLSHVLLNFSNMLARMTAFISSALRYFWFRLNLRYTLSLNNFILNVSISLFFRILVNFVNHLIVHLFDLYNHHLIFTYYITIYNSLCHKNCLFRLFVLPNWFSFNRFRPICISY